MALMTMLVVAIADSVRADRDAAAAGGYRDPFDDAGEGTTLVKAHKPPESLLDFAEYIAPVLKYYVVLLGLFAVARYFNRMLEAEDSLKEKEQLKARGERPNLRHDLMEPSDDDDDDDESGSEEESDSDDAAQSTAATKKPKAPAKATNDDDDEDDVHEELVTDGSKLVTVSASELTERRKKKDAKKQSHPLFEGLQKIEEELKQKQRDGDDADVSWNELHQSMLKRYQQKYPEHGLRVQTNDDYDDEFKALLKKHNIDPDAIRREVSKDKAA